MGDGNGRGGLWAGLIISLLAAVTFGILWFLRGGDIDRLQTELGSAQSAASSAQQRLESELRTARNDNAAKDRRIDELENRLRDDVRRAQEAGQSAERRLQFDLDMAARRLATAEQEVERLKTEPNETAQAEIETLRNNLEEAQAALARANEERAGIQEEHNAVSADLVEARQQLAGAENEIRELQALVRDLEKESSDNATAFAAVGRELARMKNELTDMAAAVDPAGDQSQLASSLRSELDDARKTIDDLKKQAEDNSRHLADIEEELANTYEELRNLREAGDGNGTSAAPSLNDVVVADTAALELESARVREQDLLRQIQDLMLRLRSAEEDAGSAVAQENVRKQDLEREVEMLRDRLTSREADFAKRMTEARDAALARIEALENECGERLRTATEELQRRFDEEREAWRKERQDEARAVEKSTPSFAEGRIVGRLPDGSTMLITGGAEQRVQPGMKFDVYRPESGTKRYIGAVRVIRVMDGYSMAVSTYGGEDVRICPVTGRAIMDPDVRTSPYADGAEPVTFSAKDTAFDAPAVGDHLDNPFFTTSRILRFGLDSDLAGNACVMRAVAWLSGVPRPADAGDLDFLLVRGAADGLKRISLNHLAHYLEPRPVF